MTPAEPSSFEDAMALAARHQEVEKWQAAQTVTAHVRQQDRQELLDCLGLSDVVRPVGL
jgi:hypothetical protein